MKIFYLTLFVTILCAQNSNSVMQATAALNAGMYEEALVHIKEAEKEDPTSSKVDITTKRNNSGNTPNKSKGSCDCDSFKKLITSFNI